MLTHQVDGRRGRFMQIDSKRREKNELYRICFKSSY